jgi:hypothetical protein
MIKDELSIEKKNIDEEISESGSLVAFKCYYITHSESIRKHDLRFYFSSNFRSFDRSIWRANVYFRKKLRSKKPTFRQYHHCFYLPNLLDKITGDKKDRY